jgi:DeoR/GlpR family transcriptional regulator of sugar metabolism
MSEMLSVSQSTVEQDLSFLQNHGILKHESSDKDGAWIIVKMPNTETDGSYV